MVIFQYTAIFIKLVQYTAMMHQKMVQQDKNNSDALTQNIHQYESDGSFIKKLVPFKNQCHIIARYLHQELSLSVTEAMYLYNS